MLSRGAVEVNGRAFPQLDITGPLWYDRSRCISISHHAKAEVMYYVATVRYGDMRYIGNFFAKFPNVRRGDRVIVRTDRGVETGEVISSAAATSDEAEIKSLNEILRRITPEDQERMRRIEEEQQVEEFKYCQGRIQELNLPMKLTSVEHLFGGTKIIFYFLADGRVDFRQLVKDLAKQYSSRIEMRQIGVRDEARLLADYEHCGRELCCKGFMKSLEPVSMRMAKNQKATLDPAKISGRCGRLMCCLRFEDPVYEEFKRNLPKKGSRVETPEGPGVVVGSEVLAQEVVVELADSRNRVTFHLSEVKRVEEKKERQGAARRG